MEARGQIFKTEEKKRRMDDLPQPSHGAAELSQAEDGGTSRVTARRPPLVVARGVTAAEHWLLILVGSFVAEQARGVWASAVTARRLSSCARGPLSLQAQ